MGQYYKPMCLETKEFVYSHDYESGLKLMEHSWVGNDFVGVVEKLIAKGGKWFGKRIVWAGDYADPEVDENGEVMKEEHNGRTYDINLYSLAVDKNKLTPEIVKLKGRKLRFLKNLDTNEFVDINKVPISDIWTDPKTKKHYPYTIHPLPLLTCEGNGRGGGDYHKESELIGKWARNRVVMQKCKPKSATEIIFDLVE